MTSTYTRVAWVAGIAALAASWVSLRDGGSTKLAAPVVSFAKADWAGLNATVHGRLYTGIPYARSCFRGASGTGGSFHAGDCAVVQDNYVNRTHRRHDFGAYMNTEWETCQATSEQCLLDASNPSDSSASASPRVCSQGSVPPYYIDVETVEDIAAGFEFAEKTGVPLVVKNTGVRLHATVN
ncbi:hypothetical protein M0805_002873 [Coniferiporia weirii]|nr:hypothetical protein M0805_002873 [Coniferiporia weirii]